MLDTLNENIFYTCKQMMCNINSAVCSQRILIDYPASCQLMTGLLFLKCDPFRL